jgi:hypothetical protein
MKRAGGERVSGGARLLVELAPTERREVVALTHAAAATADPWPGAVTQVR